MALAGGKFLAEERGLHDVEPAAGMIAEVAPEVEIQAATAPLYEVAAAHDGQADANAWLMMFWRWYGDLD